MATQKVRDRSVGISVDGLKELQAALKSASPELAKRLQQANKRIAERVATRAQSRIRAPRTDRHGRSGLGDVRASIRGSASGREARIIAGGPKAPTFFGEEFGGRARRTTQQFQPHAGKRGYFLYPTIRDQIEGAMEEWGDILEEIFKET